MTANVLHAVLCLLSVWLSILVPGGRVRPLGVMILVYASGLPVWPALVVCDQSPQTRSNQNNHRSRAPPRPSSWLDSPALSDCFSPCVPCRVSLALPWFFPIPTRATCPRYKFGGCLFPVAGSVPDLA